MKYFVKYNNWWWEYNPNLPITNTTLYNDGMGRSSDIDISGLETTIAESRSDLNWYGTEVYDNSYKTGWVSPEGKFYGCDYRRHLAQARYVHGKNEEQLESEGWLKISYKIVHTKTQNIKSLEAIYPCFNQTNPPTLEQLTFVRNNYKGNERDEMLYYLQRTKAIIKERNKKEWEK